MQLTDTAHACSIMCTFVIGDKLTRFSRCSSLFLAETCEETHVASSKLAFRD